MWCKTVFPHEELEPFFKYYGCYQSIWTRFGRLFSSASWKFHWRCVHETLGLSFSGSNSSCGWDCAANSSTVDGSARQVKIEKSFSHPQASTGKKFIDEHYPDAQLKSLLVQPMLRAMFLSIQISLLRPLLSKKVRLGIWFGINCSNYSRVWKPIHSLFGKG